MRLTYLAITLLTGSFLEASASGFPVTIDNCGQALTFTEAPKRMVVNDINMSEMAFALNLQSNMVGVTGITGWYKAGPAFEAMRGSIPELAAKYPSMENLLAVRPDLFFAGWNYGMKMGGDVTPETLNPFGIKTLILTESCIHTHKDRPAATMDLLYGDILRLGKIFGKEEAARELVSQWQIQIETIKTSLKGQSLRIFLYDSGEDKPFTAGRYAMPTALIETLGSINIMNDMNTSWGTTSWEIVAQRQPELIIILDYMTPDNVSRSQRFLANHPLMRTTPAVKNQRYVTLSYPEITPGPSNISAIAKLAEAISADDRNGGQSRAPTTPRP